MSAAVKSVYDKVIMGARVDDMHSLHFYQAIYVKRM